MHFRLPLVSVLALSLLSFPASAQAQIPDRTTAGVVASGPSQTQAPAASDRDGRVQLTAARLRGPLVFDGRLDDEIYATVEPSGNFVQQEPQEGEPATHRTDLWVFFDDRNVYIAARFWTPPENIIANELRRDHNNIWSNNDSFSVILDTFLDRRTAYFLQTSPIGAVRDGFLPEENRNTNLDLDLVWDVRSARFDGGWTTEMAVPFKSLRYPSGREQVWGFNVLRMERKINQASSWSPLPASYGGAAIFKVSSAGTVVGIEAPAHGGILDVRPYVRGTLFQDRQAVSTSASGDGAFGFDAQFKATKSINFDVSYNTDFAQVEVDNQQLNLTRFSLFYPEKRAFFLEGQSNFTFGSTLTSTQPGSDAPIFFFSRQIGLAEGRTVPINLAGRLMGRAGAFTIGAMTVQTGEGDATGTPATTFSVARIRRDILKRSSIGLLATDRRPATTGESNQVFGVDANLRFFQNVEVSSYYARSRTPSRPGDADTYAAQFRYAGDLLGAEAGHLTVGEAFNPEMGFLTRRGFARNFGSFRFSRRPEARWLRKVDWEGAVNDIASTAGDRQTSVVTGTFRVQASNGDQFSAVFTRNDDRPQAPFPVAGATIRPGAYDFNDTRVTYTVGPRRPVVGSIAVARGGFYGGEKTESVITGRLAVDRHLAVEPSFTLTWLDMPTGRYHAQLVSARTAFTVTPRMQLSALVQYSSTAASLGANARFRWEYRPGSDLYVVYTDARDTLVDGYPALLNRSFAVKFSRLVQF